MSWLQSSVLVFTSILFIVDPIAAVPSYLVVTEGQSPVQRRHTALRACVAMTVLLFLFAAAGGVIFETFGITLPAFRIAGGVILLLVALDMMRGMRTTQEGGEELIEGQAKDDVAITPLAVPILAGPGAISTAMVLASQARTPLGKGVVYVSIALTALVSYVVLCLGERMVSRFGHTGIRVLTRLMGLLLAAVAMQFVITGVKEAFGL
ncbi:MAG TPA: MarC family protein [Steroidobacteraceae bacterium]|nr:MarC family protein [Steroidobacteraceae bacterium]